MAGVCRWHSGRRVCPCLIRSKDQAATRRGAPLCLRCPFCYALLLCVTGLVLAGGVGVPRWLPLRRRPGFGVCWALFRASLIPAVMRVECAPRSGALGGLGGCDAMSLMFCRPAGPFPVPGRPGRGLSARRALLVVATQSIALRALN